MPLLHLSHLLQDQDQQKRNVDDPQDQGIRRKDTNGLGVRQLELIWLLRQHLDTYLQQKHRARSSKWKETTTESTWDQVRLRSRCDGLGSVFIKERISKLCQFRINMWTTSSRDKYQIRMHNGSDSRYVPTIWSSWRSVCCSCSFRSSNMFPQVCSSTTSVWLLCNREWRDYQDSDAKYSNRFEKCR